MDWIEYLYLAEDIIDQHSEARYRCCVSRAYYSVFCIARDAKGLDECSSDVHKIVYKMYLLSKIPPEREAAKVLDRMRLSRIKADYHKSVIITLNDAQKAIERAKKVLQNLNIPYSHP